jgi:hypothetical protein
MMFLSFNIDMGVPLMEQALRNLRTDTTMFKQKKGQILQCSNRKKDRYYNVQTEKRTDTTMFKQKKGQILQCSNRKRDKNTMIYDTLYRKLMIEQH